MNEQGSSLRTGGQIVNHGPIFIEILTIQNYKLFPKTIIRPTLKLEVVHRSESSVARESETGDAISCVPGRPRSDPNLQGELFTAPLVTAI